HRVLDADEAAVILTVDERGSVRHVDFGEILERNLLAIRCGDEDAADLLRILAILRLESYDEIVQSLALLYLFRDAAADCGFDEGVDIAGVDAVARDLGTIHRHRQRGLAELLDEGEIADPAHMFKNLLDFFPLFLEDVEIGAEHLHIERAFETGLRLIDGVLGRLRVVERDAGESLELLIDRVDEILLAAIRSRPLVVRLEPDVKLGIEEAGGIGPVVRPTVLRADDGHLGEGAQNRANF